MAKLINFLQTLPAVKFYMMANLGVMCAYDTASRHYETHYGDTGETIDEQRKTIGKRSAASGIKQKQQRVGGSQFTTNEEQNANLKCTEWDWKHFPKMHPAFEFYKWFSTSMMVYFLLKNLAPSLVLTLIAWIRHAAAAILSVAHPDWQTDSELPDRCFMLGRFILDTASTLGDITSALFAADHVLWRVAHLRLAKDYSINFVMFMLQSDRDVERFLDDYGSHSLDIDYSGPDTSYSRGVLRRAASSSSASGSKPITLKHLDSQPMPMVLLSSPPGADCDGIDAKTCAMSTGDEIERLSGHCRFLRDLMFFKVTRRWGITYKLRLNRTREARKELKKRLAYTWLISLVLYFIICPCVSIYIFSKLIYDIDYCQRYPGCSSELELLRANNTLNQRSITLTNHRVFALIAEALENLIIWFDSGWSLLFNSAFLILLNQDLLVYWTRLNAKIEATLSRVKQDFVPPSTHDEEAPTNVPTSSYLSSNNLKTNTHATSGDSHTIKVGESSISTLGVSWRLPTRKHSFTVSGRYDQDKQQINRLTRSQQLNVSLRLMRDNSDVKLQKNIPHSGEQGSANTLQVDTVAQQQKSTFEFDQSIFELQSEIKDFFDQINAVDVTVSNFLTLFMFTWFSIHSCQIYYSLSRAKPEIPISVHLILLFNFGAFTFVSINLLRLHTKCLKMCHTIRSLMAYDQSRYKRGFAKMLDTHKSLGYTLLHSYPYTPTTYLSLIGWSFSCFFIIDSLFRYRRI